MPGKSHGQRRLGGFSPWGHKESDMTEQLILLLLVAQLVKNLLQCRRPGFYLWVGKILRRRGWLPTLVFWPGESMDRGAWQATVHGVASVRHDSVTKPHLQTVTV